MCGILGSINFQRGINYSTDELLNIGSLQKHRGPDNQGVYADQLKGHFLGHNRLSILDPSEAGSQPMRSLCGNYILVYNGEIYNAQYLREKYLRGVDLQSHSDTRLLLEIASRNCMRDFIGEVDGMFAFAFLSLVDNEINLVRDKTGQKPLYFYTDNNQLWFSSEVQVLVSGFKVTTEIDYEAIKSYLNFGYVRRQNSIWSGIKKVNPGSILTFDCSSGVFTNYDYNKKFFRKQNKSLNTSDNTIQRLDTALDQSVREQLVADVPVGVYLSGGIDSSLISYYAAKHTENLKAFTVGFCDKNYDETNYAKAIANSLGLEHHIYQARPEDVQSLIENKISKFNEPLADMSQIPTLALSLFAEKHVKVVLTGDGADELFLGYSRHIYLAKYWPILSRIPLNLRMILINVIRMSPRVFRETILSSFLTSDTQINDKILRILNILQSHSLTDAYESAIELKRSAALSKSLPKYTTKRMINPAFCDSLDYLRYMDFTNYLVDDVLVKSDRMTMLASLECRAPFLADRMIELSGEIPGQLLIKDGIGKRPLRELLAKIMPNVDYKREKYGFSLPMESWIRGSLRNWARERIFSDEIRALGVFDEKIIKKDWMQHLDGKQNYSDQIMMLCVLSEWLVNWKKS